LGHPYVFRIHHFIATGHGTGRGSGLARHHVLRQSGNAPRVFAGHPGQPAGFAARALGSRRRRDADAERHRDAAGSNADAGRHADTRRHADATGCDAYAARDADAGWNAHPVAHADPGRDADPVPHADPYAHAGTDAGSDFPRGRDHSREPLVR
jgi:hypothetical protein